MNAAHPGAVAYRVIFDGRADSSEQCCAKVDMVCASSVALGHCPGVLPSHDASFGSRPMAVAGAPVKLMCACAPQERGFPDINIVMEKVAFDGITRFEDRERMPLGASQLPYPPSVAAVLTLKP